MGSHAGFRALLSQATEPIMRNRLLLDAKLAELEDARQQAVGLRESLLAEVWAGPQEAVSKKLTARLTDLQAAVDAAPWDDLAKVNQHHTTTVNYHHEEKKHEENPGWNSPTYGWNSHVEF
eukprot:6666349-Pyramimonas_sp.AAC.1